METLAVLGSLTDTIKRIEEIIDGGQQHDAPTGVEASHCVDARLAGRFRGMLSQLEGLPVDELIARIERHTWTVVRRPHGYLVSQEWTTSGLAYLLAMLDVIELALDLHYREAADEAREGDAP